MKENQIAVIIKQLNELVWGPWMLILLIGTGISLMWKLKCLPLRNLKRALLWAVGKEYRKAPHSIQKKYKRTEGGVSSFSALTTELAATIGTGNIVGVSTAMVLGGPGALLWMMLSSIIGMATKLTESSLAVKYRTINDQGEPVGGPMYVLEKAFRGRKIGQFLAGTFAVLAVLASLGMGNMTQSNSIAEAMESVFHVPPEKTGLAVTIATILVVLGGIKRISRLTGVIVPFMGVLYMAGTLLVILTHWQNIPGGIAEIVTMALFPRALAGGLAGSMTVSMVESIRWGISRGVFSNEAGLGVSGISASSAGTGDYIKQGYISMTSVFLDTCVICLATGLALVSSGVLGMTDERGAPIVGISLTIAAFETTFGAVGTYFVTLCIVLFAFATIVGWAYQGEKAFEYLVKRTSRCIWYRFIYGFAAFGGAVFSLEVVWDFSDMCNGLLVVPNLIGVLILSKGITREILEYQNFC